MDGRYLYIVGWDEHYEVSDGGRPWKPGSQRHKSPLPFVRLHCLGPDHTNLDYREFAAIATEYGEHAHTIAWTLFTKCLELSGRGEYATRGWLLGKKRQPISMRRLSDITCLSEQDIRTGIQVLTDERVEWLELRDEGPDTYGKPVQELPDPLAENRERRGKSRASRKTAPNRTEQNRTEPNRTEPNNDAQCQNANNGDNPEIQKRLKALSERTKRSGSEIGTARLGDALAQTMANIDGSDLNQASSAIVATLQPNAPPEQLRRDRDLFRTYLARAPNPKAMTKAAIDKANQIRDDQSIRPKHRARVLNAWFGEQRTPMETP